MTRNRLLAGIATLVLASAAWSAPPAPRLVVEASDGATVISAEIARPDGSTLRREIRRTAAAVEPGRTGVDPTGKAAFARWRENGREFSAWSRDAGFTWSEAAPLATELRLHDGATAPGRLLPSVPERLRLPSSGEIWLVQFRTIGLPEWREAIEAAGGRLLQFFPHHAHVVRMPSTLVPAIASLDFVERVEPFHPGYRIERPLRDWLEGSDLSPAVLDDRGRIRLNVMAFEWGPEGKRRIVEAAAPFGAEIASWYPSGQILEMWVPKEAISEVAALPDVAWIDRWGPPEDDMDLGRVDSGADWLETNFGTCGVGVRGEVMDNGIQQTHPDFDGILMHTAADTQSHGTSTFGIVFGNGARDGDGQARGTGFMPCEGAQGIFADYGNVGDRFAHTQELKGAPYFASFQSNSWGSSLTTQYNSTSSQMDDIIFRLDIAITQSQSNNGNQQSRPQAWAKNIISVGGIRHRDTLDESDDEWNSGASIGPAADGRIKPDVHYWYDSIYTTTTGSGYTSGFGGTSGATPMVAGNLGLMVKMWADDVWGTSPQGSTVFEKQPHHTTIKALVINNSKQYPFTGTTSDLTRTHQGWGRPNVQIARERAANSFVVDWGEALGVGQRANYDIQVPSGETELKVTMIYPDPPGTTSSTLHRINDVSLKVTSPLGEVFHGNVGLDAGNYSIPGGAPNGIDTVENVFVQNPAPGTWHVEITAAEVNQDGHPETAGTDVVFSLVVTGAKGGGVCGNGVREGGEQCDGADLGGLTCLDRGCGGGTLACATDCTFDTSACSGCPVCGDGVCDPGETCSTCSSDCISASAASCGNGICETADGEDCLTCAADCNGVQNGKPEGRFCCGAGGGQNPIDCTDSRCTQAGKSCTVSPVYAYCCGNRTCEAQESISTCAVDCGPPSPGEAGVPAVGGYMTLGYDRAADAITVNYGPACSATDHAIAYGDLTRIALESYSWSGRECAVGTSGSYFWPQAGLPASTFFVVVGTDGADEGSYGKDGRKSERPEDTTPSPCQVPRDLYLRCD